MGAGHYLHTTYGEAEYFFITMGDDYEEQEEHILDELLGAIPKSCTPCEYNKHKEDCRVVAENNSYQVLIKHYQDQIIIIVETVSEDGMQSHGIHRHNMKAAYTKIAVKLLECGFELRFRCSAWTSGVLTKEDLLCLPKKL